MNGSRMGMVVAVVTCGAALLVVPEFRCAAGLNEERCTPREGAASWSWTSSRLIRDADLRGLSRHELRLIRNEIYARHGYVFNSADLQQHFLQQPWYRPDQTFAEDRLSAIERANVALLLRYEGS
jgi:hypothetical protein